MTCNKPKDAERLKTDSSLCWRFGDLVNPRLVLRPPGAPWTEDEGKEIEITHQQQQQQELSLVEEHDVTLATQLFPTFFSYLVQVWITIVRIEISHHSSFMLWVNSHSVVQQELRPPCSKHLNPSDHEGLLFVPSCTLQSSSLPLKSVFSLFPCLSVAHAPSFVRSLLLSPPPPLPHVWQCGGLPTPASLSESVAMAIKPK